MEEDIHCDLCDHSFTAAQDFNNLYHFAGTVDGVACNHIHVCKACVDENDLPISFTLRRND